MDMDLIPGKPIFSENRPQVWELELRRIKQMLLSGDHEQVSVAATNSLSLMKDKESVLHMIKSDVSEFLCDAMLPFDSYLSNVIHKCLTIMAGCECFFTHNHSSFALDTIIRSIHFLIKDNTLNQSVNQSLQVIVLLIEGHVEYEVLPEKKSFENLINLMLTLLKRRDVMKEAAYQAGIIIKGLYDLEFWKLNTRENVAEVCGGWFDIITDEECRDPLTEEVIRLGCALSGQALRYLTSNENTQQQYLKTEFASDVQSRILSTVVKFLIDIAGPRLWNDTFNAEEYQCENLENYFTSIMYIFKELLPQRLEVTQRLTELGFIQHISTILSDSDFKPYDSLRRISIATLFQMLVELSDEVFHFPNMWPAGRDHFRKEILTGMSFLPLDASHWVDLLADPGENRAVKLALITYFYFKFLSMKSHLESGFVFHGIVELLNSSFGIGSSALLVKAVWFIFAVSHMSKNSVSPDSSNSSMKKLMGVLESQSNFSLIYTHHPAVLYWSFSSSKISFRFQFEVMKAWLENQTPNCTVLNDLINKSSDARLVVFEVLKNGFEHVAHFAFSALKTYILNSNDERLSYNIWFALPQILARYTTDTATVANVDCIVELATLKIPQRPDLSKMVRVTSLLPEALERSDLISLTSALQLTLQLLKMSYQHDDLRVLLSLLRYESLTQRILSGLEFDMPEVVTTSLKIISLLWSKKIHPNSGSFKRILLNPFKVLNILNKTDVDLIVLGLDLMNEMLVTGFRSDLFELREFSGEFMKILFFDLENICIQHWPIIGNQAWKCLKHCLCLKESEALAEDPLLNELIKFALPYLRDTPEFLDFLVVWVEHCTKAEGRFSLHRRIRQSCFLETVSVLTKILTENPTEQNFNLRQKILRMCEILSIDISKDPFSAIAAITKQ